MRCAGVARDCTGKPTTRVRFDGVPQPRRVCAPCLAALTRLGMNPVVVA